MDPGHNQGVEPPGSVLGDESTGAIDDAGAEQPIDPGAAGDPAPGRDEDVPQPVSEQMIDEVRVPRAGGSEPRDIGGDQTVALEETADAPGIPEVPTPQLDALADRVTRERVFEALFDASSESVALGRYQVVDTLGRGGMGTVLRAFDPTLDRLVAIKVLHKELDALHTARLRREAQALAKLSHPNVVQVYEVGDVDGQTFVAMELVKGQTLKQWMHGDPRPSWRQSVEVYLQVGAGLAAAHECGLVHRDFKPHNAIIDRKGRVRVLDFGLARQIEGVDVHESSAVRRARTDEMDPVPLELSLTDTGALLGTPAYMSPEQMSRAEADARSDQFSFCVALYETVYGHRPYEGSTMPALLLSMTHGRTRPVPREVKAPTRLRKMLLRGLAIDPQQRWASMEELLAELRGLVAPHRGPWVAMAVASGMTILGVFLWQRMMVSSPCNNAPEQLEGTWDEEQRQQVEGAIVSTGLSYAPDTWERVAERLDQYTKDWLVKYTEVCEANATADERSLEGLLAQTRCLEQRKTALNAAVNTLGKADAAMVGNAIGVVNALPPIDGCDDVDALLATIPPPADPRVAEEVKPLRTWLADLEVMHEAGKYTQALLEIGPLVQKAEALEYGPLVAETKHMRGVLLRENGQYVEAEQDLEQAHWLAMEHGHDEVAIDTATSLAFVVGYKQARYADGMRWAQTAMALAKHGGDTAKLGKSIDRLATILDHQGKYEEAERQYRRAVQLQQNALGTDHPEVATRLNNLGEILFRRGKYEEAERQYRQALQIAERALGAEHPNMAHIETGLGDVLLRQGRYDEAERELRRALAIREVALGEDHPLVADTVSSLGLVRHSQGKYEEAAHHHRHALRIREQTFEADHPDVANSLNHLGNALSRQGRYDEAKQYFERARKSFEHSVGEDHPNMAESVYNLGALLHDQKKYEEAEQEFRRALRIWKDALGEDHPNVAMSHYGLGLVLHDQQEHEEAERELRRALQIRERVLGKDHPDVAMSHYGLGLVLNSQGSYEEAEQELRRALQIQEHALSEDHPDLANSANNLGVMLYLQGRYEEAERYYQQALLVWERALGADHPNLAHSLNNLGIVVAEQGEYETAKRYYERALRINEKALGPDHPSLAPNLSNLGDVFHTQGEYEEAKRYYERALRIWEKALGPDHPNLAYGLTGLGDVFSAQGQHNKAKRYHEQALQIREKALGADHPLVADPLVGLAEVALAQHDVHAAREHAERAVSIFEATTVTPVEFAKARFVLARTLWSDSTQRARARKLAEQARDAFAEHGKGAEDDLTETEAWLVKHRAQ